MAGMPSELDKFMQKSGIWEKGKKGRKAFTPVKGTQMGERTDLIPQNKAAGQAHKQTPGKDAGGVRSTMSGGAREKVWDPDAEDGDLPKGKGYVKGKGC